MKIGILSKFEVSGGSEFRCIEMANAIKKYTDNESVIFATSDFCEKLKPKLNKEIEIRDNFFANKKNLKHLYNLDSLLIVNSDSKDYTSIDFWHGRSIYHNLIVDLAKIKQISFLFNFIISPSRQLYSLEELCSDIRIITTNTKFFNEIGSQDRYDLVRHYPRLKLESPIDPESISQDKSKSDSIRIGMHSKGVDSKWNEELPKLIDLVNKKYPVGVSWDFMGTHESVAKKIKGINNVTIRKEFSIPVKEYLNGIDIFLFFPSWKREEPWARSVAEGLTSGCPVIATDKGGNQDQIIQGNNGFLCKNLEDFFRKTVFLIEHKNIIKKMGKNARLQSREFTSEKIVNKFLNFINN